MTIVPPIALGATELLCFVPSSVDLLGESLPRLWNERIVPAISESEARSHRYQSRVAKDGAVPGSFLLSPLRTFASEIVFSRTDKGER
jgi:hypothetical protein